jgi:hypothetical protein
MNAMNYGSKEVGLPFYIYTNKTSSYVRFATMTEAVISEWFYKLLWTH